MSEELLAHIDLSTLEMLKEVMEDDFLMLISTYINDSEIRLQELNEASEANANESLRRAAHCFKGSSSNIGAQSLSLLCQQLEQVAIDGDWPDISAKLQAIHQEANIVLSLLRQHFIN